MPDDFTCDGFIAGLGGRHNILSVQACITRLRAIVADASLVDEGLLTRVGASSVIRTDEQVHVIVDSLADSLAEGIRSRI